MYLLFFPPAFLSHQKPAQPSPPRVLDWVTHSRHLQARRENLFQVTTVRDRAVEPHPSCRTHKTQTSLYCLLISCVDISIFSNLTLLSDHCFSVVSKSKLLPLRGKKPKQRWIKLSSCLYFPEEYLIYYCSSLPVDDTPPLHVKYVLFPFH